MVYVVPSYKNKPITQRNKLPKTVSRDDLYIKTWQPWCPISSPFEWMPKDILQFILIDMMYEYTPLLREVCKKWATCVGPGYLFEGKLQQRLGNVNNDTDSKNHEETHCGASYTILPRRHIHTLAELARNGDLVLLKWIMSRGNYMASTTPMTLTTMLRMMGAAARMGHLSTLEWLYAHFCMWNDVSIETYKCVLRNAIQSAVLGGHQLIVDHCCTKWKHGTSFVTEALRCAVLKKQDHIITQCLQWGAKDYDCLLEYAASTGDWNLAEFAKSKGATEFGKAIAIAARHGHAQIMRVCFDWGVSVRDVNDAMVQAARQGFVDLVLLCKEWGATDYDRSLRVAANYGHVNIVTLCKEWGATEFRWPMRYAARNGHDIVVKLCKEWDILDIVPDVITSAAEGGHLHIIQMCASWQRATNTLINYNDVMRAAAKGGHIALVRHCKENENATAYNEAFVAAANGGHEDVVRLCKTWGATAYDDAMEAAVSGNHPYIVHLCVQYGATRFAQAMKQAVKNANQRMVRQIMNYAQHHHKNNTKAIHQERELYNDVVQAFMKNVQMFHHCTDCTFMLRVWCIHDQSLYKL